MKTIIGIGPTVDRKRLKVTGLSMMYELTLSVAKESGFQVKSISINSRLSRTDLKIASPNFLRFIDYLLIFIEAFWSMLVRRKAIVYINPATTIFGLKRDCLLVKMAKLLGHSVVFQQFGALFSTFCESLSKENYKKLEYTYNAVDKIIVEGEFARQQYSFISNQDKIIVINNGLPEAEIKPVKKGKDLNLQTPFRLFFMNNMIESKGYIDVLKAVGILVNQKKYPIECSFAGRFLASPDDQNFSSPDEARRWFNNYICEQNLKDVVKYYNGVFGGEKADLFLSSNVFLLPSYYIFEGQPTALLEALSYGCVPIVTEYRLIPEAVDGTCGIFVKPKSPKSIADAVESLINNPSLFHELSNGSIRRYEERFTREKYAANIKSVLNNLQNG